MSNNSFYCLNPHCKSRDGHSKLQTESNLSYCVTCGSKLLLSSRYRALREIGAGTFGRTYLAIDEKTQLQCVIKQFKADKWSQNPQNQVKAKILFEQEAKVLRKLGSHSQIPEIYGFSDEDIFQPSVTFRKERYLYLFLEFVEGCNLLEEVEKRLENKEPLFDEASIRAFLMEMLPILRFIHENNIIHRDIKPENIMRRASDGKFVLIDFGGVKEYTNTSLGKTGTRLFTEGYAPIEQIRKKSKAYPCSDLYSLGVTCVYLLTGMEPSDAYEKYQTAGTGFPLEECLKGQNVTVSSHFHIILRKLLEDEMDKRYALADDVLRDLLPKVELIQSHIELRANKLGEQIASSIAIKNHTPDSILEGEWKVTPHPADPPTIGGVHHWIQVRPSRFKTSGSITCKLLLDTSKLKSSKHFCRELVLITNAFESKYQIKLDVYTYSIKSEIKLGPLIKHIILLLGVASLCAMFSHYFPGLLDLALRGVREIWNLIDYTQLENSLRQALDNSTLPPFQ